MVELVTNASSLSWKQAAFARDEILRKLHEWRFPDVRALVMQWNGEGFAIQWRFYAGPYRVGDFLEIVTPPTVTASEVARAYHEMVLSRIGRDV